MSAQKQLAPIKLGVYNPEPDAAPSLFAPVPSPPAEQQRMENPLSLFGARIAQEFADVSVSDEDRRRAKTELTLPEFYRRFLLDNRRRKLDPKTVRLDGDALAWLASTCVPEGWPEFEPWEGPPIGCITSTWLQSLADASIAAGLSANTIGKYLRHLRAMLNAAAAQKLVDKLQVAIPSEETDARPFTDAEVERIYRALAECPVLQVAFVVALGTGARFGDLFWLTWDSIDFDRQQIAFTAEKTGKAQVVPLVPVVEKHLLRLPRYEAPFASLVDINLEPDYRAEHYRSRMLNARWRHLTGFPAPPRRKRDRPADAIVHPWHSARSTAGMWIERAVAGMASRLLGHVVDLQDGERTTKRYYLVPLCPRNLREAAAQVIWPPYFQQILEPRQKLLF